MALKLLAADLVADERFRERFLTESRLYEMENQEWQEIVDALVDAKRCLASAWQILDGTVARPPVSNPR